MNKFWVQFSSGTTIDNIMKGLKAVPAEDVEILDNEIQFTAEWGTTQRDINNLKGRIESQSGRNSVEDIGVLGQ